MSQSRHTASERFWSKVDKEQDGCWNWTGFKWRGYGRFAVRTASGKWENVRAHRWIWEQVNGLIPDGMQIDHLCRNPSCVNPAHMEVVTPRENSLRGTSPNIITHKTGICKNGHAISGDNVGIKSDGVRYCKTCAHIRFKQWHEANPNRRRNHGK